MSHHDETFQGLGAPGLAPGDEPIRQAAPLTANSDPELAELQRSLLIYGTAGQAARVRMGGRTA